MLHPINHTVQEGDTLSGLARKYHMPSWESIFDAPENADLKARRKVPNRIQPNDRIIIPPNPIAIIDQKVAYLKNLDADARRLTERMLREAEANYKEVSFIAQSVDAAAMVFGIVKGLGSMVKAGLDTMGKTGVELAKAQQKMATKALLNGPKRAGKAVLKHSGVLTPTAEDGMALAFSKIVVKSWFDMTSPSYWTGRITGVNIHQVYHDTCSMISRQQEQSSANIALRIDALEEERMRLTLSTSR